MGVIEGTHTAIPDRGTKRRRWLAAGHEPSPQLMVVLDLPVMNTTLRTATTGRHD